MVLRTLTNLINLIKGGFRTPLARRLRLITEHGSMISHLAAHSLASRMNGEKEAAVTLTKDNIAEWCTDAQVSEISHGEALIHHNTRWTALYDWLKQNGGARRALTRDHLLTKSFRETISLHGESIILEIEEVNAADVPTCDLNGTWISDEDLRRMK